MDQMDRCDLFGRSFCFCFVFITGLSLYWNKKSLGIKSERNKTTIGKINATDADISNIKTAGISFLALKSPKPFKPNIPVRISIDRSKLVALKNNSRLLLLSHMEY